jgi:hypothetical protein
MLLTRLYDTNLAQASFLLGCRATGEALVVDANHDIDQYCRTAADAGLHITHVTATHIHTDFVSGSRALAAADGATLVRDGYTFMVGNLRIDVLHAPGHTAIVSRRWPPRGGGATARGMPPADRSGPAARAQPRGQQVGEPENDFASRGPDGCVALVRRGLAFSPGVAG